MYRSRFATECGALELEGVLPTLARSSRAKAGLIQALGVEDSGPGIQMLEAGAVRGPIGGAIHDFFADEIQNEGEAVWSGYTYDINEPDNTASRYPISVVCYEGVYFVSALEEDPVGYFLELEAAKSYLYSNWPYVEPPYPVDVEGEGSPQNVDDAARPTRLSREASDDVARPFKACLTPGCVGSPLGVPPNVAWAVLEHQLHADPRAEFAFTCPRCGGVSRHGPRVVLGLIPEPSRPRPLPPGAFWALALLEIGTGPASTERTFAGERVLARELAKIDHDLIEAELLSPCDFAPSLKVGDRVACERWQQAMVLLCILVDGEYREISLALPGGGANNNRIGLFWARRGDAAPALRFGNVPCTNPSCGAMFSLTQAQFHEAASRPSGQADFPHDMSSRQVVVTCNMCHCARVVDDASFDQPVDGGQDAAVTAILDRYTTQDQRERGEFSPAPHERDDRDPREPEPKSSRDASSTVSTTRRTGLPAQFEGVESWTTMCVLVRGNASHDEHFATLERVLGSDPVFAPHRTAGYPFDLRVEFPTTLSRGGAPTRVIETMWVRTVGIGREPNRWVGRLLNDPQYFRLARQGEYVEFRCDQHGLCFEHVITPTEDPARD